MTKLLAIETSSEACSVALSLDGEVREIHEHAPLRHAERLLPAVMGLIAEAGMSLADLDAIAFGQGPGSFTSLRIGIGVVQGLAWGAELPVVPCSSLAALAQAAADRSGAADGYVSVAVDARMQEVFAAGYAWADGLLVGVASPERVGAPAEAVGQPPPGFIAAGNGFERFAELHPLCAAAAACYPDLWPQASAVARLAVAWLGSHEPLPAERAQPVYVRNQVAVKPSPQ